jgi:hypothetical protein
MISKPPTEKKTDRKYALLSWRVIAEIAMSSDEKVLSWLTSRQRKGGVLVCQLSLIKAATFIRRRCEEKSIDSYGLLDRFLRRYIALHSIIDASAASRDLYSRLAGIAGKEDLEIFALCVAFQNSYLYVHWDADDADFAARLIPDLALAKFEAYFNDV